ncbi:MAG: hypothetical protein WD100_08680 [Tistlia sp.]|uniref:hypothetical protein n=1 Tax=Tistlia sp. TaxID=3057121 RepID=UPI0034A536FA
MAATQGSQAAPQAAASLAGRDGDHSSYVDWPAIFAGAVVASALFLIFAAFGSAIGLSIVDFDEGTPGTFLIIAMGLWSLWTIGSSYMAGAYIAGRLRRRHAGATEHEADVRDGAHGLAVWGVSILVGAFVLSAGAMSTARIGAEAVSGAASSAASAAASLDESTYQRFADSLLRPGGEGTGTAPRAGAGTAADREASGAEVGRILSAAEDGTLGEDDSEYLASLVAQRTGMSEEEAQARVEEVAGQLQAAEQQAIEAAEAARQMAVLAAFIAAASLLVAAAGSWWAAGMGGQHRDEQTVLALFGRRR